MLECEVQIVGDPIGDAFKSVVERIYWEESLERAEEILEDFIANMDEDIRELLLDRRKRICENPGDLEDARLYLALQTVDDEKIVKLLELKLYIKSLFLIQCTSEWSSMSPKEKAHILTPLYKASYGVELAAREIESPLFDAHLDASVASLEEALRRISEAGLDAELERIVKKSIDNVIEIISNSIDKDEN